MPVHVERDDNWRKVKLVMKLPKNRDRVQRNLSTSNVVRRISKLSSGIKLECSLFTTRREQGWKRNTTFLVPRWSEQPTFWSGVGPEIPVYKVSYLRFTFLYFLQDLRKASYAIYFGLFSLGSVSLSARFYALKYFWVFMHPESSSHVRSVRSIGMLGWN